MMFEFEVDFDNDSDSDSVIWKVSFKINFFKSISYQKVFIMRCLNNPNICNNSDGDSSDSDRGYDNPSMMFKNYRLAKIKNTLIELFQTFYLDVAELTIR
jgi:hypothetical protein